MLLYLAYRAKLLIEVHYDEDATRFYLYHNMTPDVKSINVWYCTYKRRM